MPRTRTALIWSPAAQRDIARLYDFIKSDNPEAAKRAIQYIKKSALSLVDFPALGKRLEGRQDREIFISFGKRGYVMRYRLDGVTPVVLRIWHALENRED
jgi:plasmid stabilization system protein ParE